MKIELRDISDVLPYEQNAKIHTQDQVAKIAHSIQTYGWDQPIVIDADGVIIKGHGRRLAAINLGLTEVPVLVRDDLSPEQVRAARIADNNVALGTFDQEIMKDEIKALIALNADITSLDLGASDDEILQYLDPGDPDIDGLLEGADIAPDDDDEDDPLDNPRPEPKEANYTPAYHVVVECADEADQEKVYDLLSGQGYKVKVQSM